MPPDDIFPQGVILTGSHDHTILAYTLSSPKPIYKLSGHVDTVCTLSAGKFGAVISGSWDKSAKVWLKEKCVMTLQGHEAAVWSVAIMPERGNMLTGSADKTIKLWRVGRCEKTFFGHSDCVRGLAVVNGDEFLSCSNDATVRRWVVSGECLQVYYGHTNYVYCIALLSNGTDFVTCGEDRSLRVWRNGGECVQTITHPAQSVWSVTVLDNGDVVTGASDGVLRVFTENAERFASPEELAAFIDVVASSTIPAQIGDIKTDELVGPDALNSSGKQDGQTLMIRRDDAIEAHQWDAASQRWVKVGDIIGGSGGSQGSSGKVLYDGKEYDYVFDVEIYENKPPLKLPYNCAEDPWQAAHSFLEHNEISQMFLDQVANFIQEQTKGVTLGSAHIGAPSDPFTGGARYMPGSRVDGNSSCDGSNVDPLTGGSRYIPSSTQRTSQITNGASDPFTGGSRYQPGSGSAVSSQNMYFPQDAYIIFDQINVQGIFTKLREFNGQMGDGCRLTDLELEQMEVFVAAKSDPTADQLSLLWRLLHWPSDVLFPALDVLRHCLSGAVFNTLICQDKDGARFIDYCLELLANDSAITNHRLILRALCNAFQHAAGEALVVAHSESIIKAIVRLHHPAEKQIQIAVSSLILNLVIAGRRESNVDGITQCLITIAELSQHLTHSESCFRLMVAIGTAVYQNKSRLELASSLGLSTFIQACLGAEKDEKAHGCATTLSNMFG
jgi:phospholipase A-2-activating protein